MTETDGPQPDIPDALTSEFFLAPNQPLDLYQGAFVIDGDPPLEAEGKIALHLEPAPALTWSGIDVTDPPLPTGLVVTHILSGGKNWDLTGISTRGEMPGHGDLMEHSTALAIREDELSGSGAIRSMMMGDPSAQLGSLDFVVLNFADIQGSSIRSGSTHFRGRTTMLSKDWRITLDQRPNLSDTIEDLRRVGGFAVTHSGSLRRLDGSTFATAEGGSVVDSLHWFLSFVRGAWAAPTMMRGFDSDGTPVWSRWFAPRCDRWRASMTWCDPVYSQALPEAFDGYMDRWSSSDAWQGAIRTAIGMYVSANWPHPLEQAIIAAQSGLELLSWLLVAQPNAIPHRHWKNVRADKRIARLLAIESIDPSIPDSMNTLAGLDKNWKSGPEVVAGIRNRLVHPRVKNGSTGWPHDVLVDCWLLACRYLEMSLLFAFGVASPVRDRLSSDRWVGAVSLPPWV